MAAFQAGIAVSQQTESECLPPANSSTTVILQRGTRADSCLTATGATNESPVNGTGDCTGHTALEQWHVDPLLGALFLASAPTMCFHTDNSAPSPCSVGNAVHLGDHCMNAIVYDVGAGTLTQPGCPGKCAAATGSGGALEVADCSSPAAVGWVARIVASQSGDGAFGMTRLSGAYVHPLD